MLDLSAEIDELWDDLQAALSRVLRSGQFILGEEVSAFEREVADYLGVKHAIGVNSGTDALVIALDALGIGAGDEVITTSFSFFATAEAISRVGAIPVFVDIDLDTYNLNVNTIEAAITPNTKAIVPVHLFGRPAAMSQIVQLARTHNLKVVEDCAQAFGASYHGDCIECAGMCDASTRQRLTGKKVGSLGDVGAFSFYPTKNLGAYGDAGLMTTNDDEVAANAKMLRNHGSAQAYDNVMLGYNSRLDSLQAAILRVKLEHVDTWNAARRQRAQAYNDLLNDLLIDAAITPAVSAGHVFHQYTVRFASREARAAVMQALHEAGIGHKVFYPHALPDLPLYQATLVPNAQHAAETVLSLPLWAGITQAQQQQVVQVLTGVAVEAG